MLPKTRDRSTGGGLAGCLLGCLLAVVAGVVCLLVVGGLYLGRNYEDVSKFVRKSTAAAKEVLTLARTVQKEFPCQSVNVQFQSGGTLGVEITNLFEQETSREVARQIAELVYREYARTREVKTIRISVTTQRGIVSSTESYTFAVDELEAAEPTEAPAALPAEDPDTVRRPASYKPETQVLMLRHFGRKRRMDRQYKHEAPASEVTVEPPTTIDVIPDAPEFTGLRHVLVRKSATSKCAGEGQKFKHGASLARALG